MKSVFTFLLTFITIISIGQVRVDSISPLPYQADVHSAVVLNDIIYASSINNTGSNGKTYMFDGSNWTELTPSNSGILSGITADIYEYDGKVYFASNKGISILNNGQWSSITSLNSSLISDSCFAISATKDGIVVVHNRGISVRETDKSTWTNLSHLQTNTLASPFDFKLGGRPHFFQEKLYVGRYLGDFRIIDFVKKDTTIISQNIRDIAQFDGQIYFLDQDSGVYYADGNQLIELGQTDCERANVNGIYWDLLIDENGYFFQAHSIVGDFIIDLHTTKKNYRGVHLGKFFQNRERENLLVMDEVNDRLINLFTGYYIKKSEYVELLEDPTEFATVDINNRITPVSNLGQRSGLGPNFNFREEAPKNSCKQVDFTGGLWIGGLDLGNNLHLAAMTYRQRGQDFWPGPLDTMTANISESTVLAYDRVWKVSKGEIQHHIDVYNNNGVVNKVETAESIWNWPGNGSGGAAIQLAPYIDLNGNGIYEPDLGEYPDVPGDQCIYWIMNDVNLHQESSADPLFVEIHGQAYGYDCERIGGNLESVNNTIFYKYKIINRSIQFYTDVIVSQWLDSDIGFYGDDGVGCHVTQNMGYSHNNDDMDQGKFGFGKNPPMSSMVILKSPIELDDGVDGDGDGQIDEEDEKRRMGSFVAYNNTFDPINGNPSIGADFYNYMQGKFMNRDKIFHPNGGETTYMYPGRTDPGNTDEWKGWGNGSNTPKDLRILISSYPFELAPRQEVEFEFASIYSRDESQYEQLPQMLDHVESIKSWYYDRGYPECFNPVGIEDIEKQISATIYPNPTNGRITIQTEEVIQGVEVYSFTGLLVEEMTTTNATSLELNLSSLTKGVYVIHIETNEGLARKKVVKL